MPISVRLRPERLRPERLRPERLRPERLRPERLRPERLRPERLRGIAVRCIEAALAGGLAAAVSGATFAVLSRAEAPARAASPGQTTLASRPVNASTHSLAHQLAAPATHQPAAHQPPRACGPHAALTHALAAVLRGQSGSLAVAVTDLSTAVTASYHPRELFHTASMVKADILATLLLQLQRQHAGLSPAEQELATEMIENSDNDAASALWDTIGAAAGLAAADRVLGLRYTEPGPDGLWGLTATTVTDQLRLLAALTSTHSPLTAAARHYELALMRSVAEGQNWGVTAAADPGSGPAVKNGWLPDGPSGQWVINSIGVLRHHGQRLLIAVLSSGQPTQAVGISQVQAAASAAAASVTEPACPSQGTLTSR